MKVRKRLQQIKVLSAPGECLRHYKKMKDILLVSTDNGFDFQLDGNDLAPCESIEKHSTDVSIRRQLGARYRRR